MDEGIVKWFKEGRNFGVIIDDKGNEFFVRGSDIQHDKQRVPLIQGENVEFEPGTYEVNGEERIKATNVKIRCEVQQNKIGVIVRTKEDKGYGFLNRGDESCLYYISKFNRHLKQGQYVKYVEIDADDDKKEATNLAPLKPMIGRVSHWHQGSGTIIPEGGADIIFQVSWHDLISFKKDSFRALREDDSVSFVPSPAGNGTAICVRKISPMERFALVDNEEKILEDLAENKLLKGEHWQYKDQQSHLKYPILSNYIRNTFRRLEEEDKAQVDDNKKKIMVQHEGKSRIAIFNTGLVNCLYKPLYAVFTENLPHEVGTQYWRLIGFCSEGDNINKINYTRYFADLPARAEYFHEPVNLLYNSKLRLEPVTIHILDDREYRLPQSIRQNINKDMSSDEILVFLDRFLKQAIETAKERILWNYKTAVPQWSFKNNCIQLLIPLCIANPQRVDCALAVQKEEHVYIGYTILPLDWAYSNARLIARPHSDWLDPNNIAEITDENDGE